MSETIEKETTIRGSARLFCMKLAMSCNPRDSSNYRHHQRRGGGRPHHQESRTNIDALQAPAALPPKKAADQLLEDRQCDASKPRKETVANYVLGQRIMSF